MNVVITGGGTGGHLMPALAIAAALERRRPDVVPVLVGAERGIEARVLPGRGYRYHLLPAEPLYRGTWWRNLRWPLLLPRLLARAGRILDEERPALVVGTGGYAAFPVLFAARRRRIPIALEEQNAFPGITTRRFANVAAQIHLGFPEAEGRLRPGPNTRVFTLGNPVVPPNAPERDAGVRAALGLPVGVPVVLVMGGSQGAAAINRVLAEALNAGGLENSAVLWSTGAAEFERYEQFARPPFRQIRPFWDPIAEAYAAADLVVARAGAMTTAELQAWGLPSVLIPLPTAAADHQSHNAAALAAVGAAVHLPQAELTAARLTDLVEGLLADRKRLAEMAGQARQRGHPGAAEAVATELLRLISEPPSLS